MLFFSRTIAVSALAGAALLTCPSIGMAADSTAPAATQPMPAAAQTKAETVEQRISSLHASLQITPSEETDWNGVTKSMRANAAAMDKLIAEKDARAPAGETAVQDLMNYEKFAQAHVAGLKSLTASFETLYKAMPDAQKRNADQVFDNFGHKPGASHS